MNSILNSTCEEQIQCWNNHLTECNNSVFTANNSNVYMPYLTETNNNLIYSDYNLKLLPNQSTIPDFTCSPNLISIINSNPSFINDTSQCQPQQQQTLSLGLTSNIPQNGNSYFQRVLSNTNMNNSVTNILPTDSSSHFNSLDMLNNFISFINTPTTLTTNIFTSNQLIPNQPCGRPIATTRSLNSAAAVGQPIGEAMIQFVTELSAQTVCEQKHKSIFTKYGLPIPVGVYVDVIQCTREDLNQLLSNMSRNIGIFTNNLISSSSTSRLSNLINPIIFTQLHHFDDITPMLKSSIPLQSGYGIEQTNFLRIKSPEFRLNPFISNEELNSFNVPPPTSNLPNYITGINSTFSFPTPLIDNNITNALIQCTPPLSNMLGFQIPNLIYQTSIPNFFTNNSMLNNNESTELLSTSIPYLTNCHKNKDNIINNGYNLSEFKGNSDWTNSWSNNRNAEQITIMNSPEMQVYKTNHLVASKTENKPIIVTVQGFPKEMTTSDFTKWLEKKINNVKILSVQFEHSLLNEISNGFAKVYLQNNSDAELIVQEFNNTILNNSRISAQIN
ncbi:unnamed protein product [Schistosoma mattheei]|uniref:Uncharacterized protein n=2 Tax=Schistosoma mattheei TaxID=31246 RepID=A0A183PJS7_9TREM|nr:unnamed protein product [Schistosoma mattheei]